MGSRNRQTSIRIAFVLVAVLRLAGQSTSGELAGIVESQDRKPLPGVALTLTQRASGLEREVKSGPDGHYVIPALAAGDYSLKAELTNFRTSGRSRIAASSGAVNPPKGDLKTVSMGRS